MSTKAIVCRCEDVTLADVAAHASRSATRRVEEVKRYTGLGTGPCQGKECMVHAARLCARAQRRRRDASCAVHLAPAGRSRRRSAIFARPETSDDDEAAMKAKHPSRPQGRPSATCEIAIIGGGVMGLGIAYHLAKRGLNDVVVLERGYLAQGASGRNGGGVRMQWSTELNVRLMQESIELCRRFAQEIGVNVWFRQGGYLFLASTSASARMMERNVALQNRCGVPTRMLDARGGAARIVPELDVNEDRRAPATTRRTACSFPWPFLWGYAHQALKRGVEVHLFTDVTAIERATAAASRCRTTKGDGARRARHQRRRRLVARGGAPGRRRAAEPAAPPRDPLDRAAQAVPDADGERAVVGALLLAVDARRDRRRHHRRGSRRRASQLGSRLKFLTTLAREMVSLMPRFADVKVLRQWAGPVRRQSPTATRSSASRRACPASSSPAASSATAS